MTLQHALFSFNGRMGRRDFWIWMVSWLVLMVAAFTFADRQWIEVKSAAFAVVVLLWPTAAVMAKRLHDRNRSALWAFMFILAWMLAAGHWDMMPTLWQWGVGRLIPIILFVLLIIDCGLFAGTPGANRFGPEPENVKLK